MLTGLEADPVLIDIPVIMRTIMDDKNRGSLVASDYVNNRGSLENHMHQIIFGDFLQSP